MVFISCNHSLKESKLLDIIDEKTYDNNDFINDTILKDQNFNLDSVKIKTVYYTRPVLQATFSLVDSCIHVNSIKVSGKLNKIVCENKLTHQIKKYISDIYIEKSNNIELSRKKNDYITSMDYPYLNIRGYIKENEVINETTQLGDEEYEIEFSPKFLEFYELLKKIASEETN